MKINQTMKMLMILTLFLLPAIGFNIYGQTPVKLNKQSSAQSVQSAKKLGVFSNMRSTAEHQYDYKVELWQEGDRVFGLFLASEGLIGDTPTGGSKTLHSIRKPSS